jgi:hypothetical protein
MVTAELERGYSEKPPFRLSSRERPHRTQSAECFPLFRWFAAVSLYDGLQGPVVHRLQYVAVKTSFIGWHAQQGTPMSVLQELGGWESEQMVRRYAHFAPEHLPQPHSWRAAALSLLGKGLVAKFVNLGRTLLEQSRIRLLSA